MIEKTPIEKHITTILVSIITAIVVGIGVTTIQNTQTSARIETKIDFMTSSFNEYKVSQKELVSSFDVRLQKLEDQIYRNERK